MPIPSVIDSAWPEPITQAVVVTPESAGLDTLVFGISPRLQFDFAYRELFEQIIEQMELAASRLEAFRLRAELESERRNLLLQAPVATALLTGPRHVFELANPLYLEIVGGRDVAGKAYLDAFPELVGTPLAAVLDRVYQTGQPFVTHEYLIPLDRSGDGTLENCYYKFSLEPVRRGDGSVYGMMAVAVDIQSLDEHGADEAPASEVPRSVRIGAGQRLSGARILVVDDQDDARELVAAVLERAGAIVTQADSVAKALQALEAGEIAAMVSDIAMPEEDGYSLIRRLRSRELPALALTAYARPEDRQKALAAGFQEHAAKPIDPNLLIDLVAGLLGT